MACKKVQLHSKINKRFILINCYACGEVVNGYIIWLHWWSNSLTVNNRMCNGMLSDSTRLWCEAIHHLAAAASPTRSVAARVGYNGGGRGLLSLVHKYQIFILYFIVTTGNLNKEQARLHQVLQDKENIILSQRQEIHRLDATWTESQRKLDDW